MKFAGIMLRASEVISQCQKCMNPNLVDGPKW